MKTETTKLNRKQRTAARRARLAAGIVETPKVKQVRPRGYVDPKPLDGASLPDPAQGWMPDKPSDDPTLICVAVRCIRFDDASTRKFYRCILRAVELKKLRNVAKKKLKQIQREDAAAAKRRVKLLLVMMGKA